MRKFLTLTTEKIDNTFFNRGLGQILALLFLLTFGNAFSSAQSMQPPTLEPGQNRVRLDVPVAELPFNTSHYNPTYFSMRQSMELTNSFYQLFHRWIGGEPGTEGKTGRIWGIAAFDLVTTYVPLGSSWLHEEWHRSVMSNRKIGSFNDVNTFPFGASLIAVSHVDDADLIRLKRDHPADQVRMSSAGMEAQVQQNLALQKRVFFENAPFMDRILMWMNMVNVAGYLSTCSSIAADQSTQDQNREDGHDVSRRDFTGLDCTAWVYDLFRPDEPYEQRGNHPSGVGLDRYILYSDLSEKEKRFLSLQSNLSLLNAVDPFLFGYSDFSFVWDGTPVFWNAKLSHMITSFGGTVDAHLFLRSQKNQIHLTLHNGMTDTRYFPGFTIEMIDVPIPNSENTMTTSLTLWPQPRDQRVETSAAEFLFHASAEWNHKFAQDKSVYLGVDAKTPGWLAGNVYLDRNVSTWAGFRMSVF